MKILRVNSEEFEYILRKGWIPIRKVYHWSKGNALYRTNPDRIYVGVEFEVVGLGDSPIATAHLQKYGFSAEADATVTTEYVIFPQELTYKEADEVMRDLYQTLLKIVELGRRYGELDIDYRCGLHHHLSVPGFVKKIKKVNKKRNMFDALAHVYYFGLEDFLVKNSTLVKFLFGRGFQYYCSIIPHLYRERGETGSEKEKNEFKLLSRGEGGWRIRLDQDRHNWVNMRNLARELVNTIEYRLPTLRPTLEENMRMWKVIKKIHFNFLHLISPIYKWDIKKRADMYDEAVRRVKNVIKYIAKYKEFINENKNKKRR